ncbi:transcriptional regulator [Martelella mediterranea]|uniref:Transcriptional regulator n=2 Tax=Martelella mediterranea TaxID=293089 RepID=A0A4R3NUT9_9HYPH|nr:transcriptional regulator [Martelella mediterranea]
MKEIARLRDACDEKEERIRQLEAEITRLDDMAEAMRFGLTPTELKLWAMLKRRGRVDRQAIYTVIYGDRADGGPKPKTIDVLMCKLRHKVQPLGYQVESSYGHGWRLVSPKGGAA